MAKNIPIPQELSAVIREIQDEQYVIKKFLDAIPAERANLEERESRYKMMIEDLQQKMNNEHKKYNL